MCIYIYIMYVYSIYIYIYTCISLSLYIYIYIYVCRYTHITHIEQTRGITDDRRLVIEMQTRYDLLVIEMQSP